MGEPFSPPAGGRGAWVLPYMGYIYTLQGSQGLKNKTKRSNIFN